MIFDTRAVAEARAGAAMLTIVGALEYWLATSDPDYDQSPRQELGANADADAWTALEPLAERHHPHTAT